MSVLKVAILGFGIREGIYRTTLVRKQEQIGQAEGNLKGSAKYMRRFHKKWKVASYFLKKQKRDKGIGVFRIS